jgi:hypothetical protein
MLRSIALLTMAAAWGCSGGAAAGPPAAAGSFAPYLSASGDRVVLSWVEPDSAGRPTLRFATREGHGWTAARTVVRNAALASDNADVPAVVPLGDGSLAAHWTVKRDGSPHARDLMVATSNDGGQTWSAPVRPHRDDTASEHGMATLVPANATGAFGICWLDGRAGALSEYGEGGTSLYWADWSGGAFGPDVLLDPRVCDCCKTSAAEGSRGPLVAYRDRSTADKRDISVVHREGTAWSTPRPVHDDGWSLTACPTNGPAIATRGELTAVAWFTGANATPAVWAALSADGGTTLAAPVRVDGGSPVGRVDATMLPDGSAAVVWLERKGGSADVSVRRISAGGGAAAPLVVAKTSPARASGYPRVVATGARDVLVAWTETGPPGRVRAATVTLP